MSTETYDELTAVPVPTAAFLHDHVIQAHFSIIDHGRNVKRTLSKSISLDSFTATPSEEVIGVVNTAYSASGKLKAILRETGDEKDKKRLVEIWNNDTVLLACKDVSDVHGIFYADAFFDSLCFSDSEKYITYVAEKKKPTEKNSFEKFKYSQPFGEGLVGKYTPVLFLFDWQTDRLVSLDYDAPVWFGQALFGPSSDDKIFATGYETASDERLLGIKSCYNRPTGIWELIIAHDEKNTTDADSLKCHVSKLTASHISCRSPRVISSNGKSTLLWVSQPTGGAHGATSALHSLDITSSVEPSQTRTLVDTVWEPAEGDFPGLYLLDSGLPRTPYVHWGEGDYIVTPTNWGSRFTIVLISLYDGTVKELTPVVDEKLLSWSAIMASKGNKLVCVRSSLTNPFEMVLGDLGASGSVSWNVVHKAVLSEQLQSRLNSLTVKIVSIPDRFPTETILIQDKAALQDHKILPCISIPHGGPHGANVVSFSAPVCFLALEGYTVSLPNYTGSTGYGEKYIRALIGQCGQLDVGDCIESVRHLVKIGAAKEGRGNLLLAGGSHGGFLLGHLIGQYPEVFTSAVLRNPVISAGEISTSDIQDWYFSEFGLDYPLSSLPLGYTGPSTSSKVIIPPRIVTPEVYSKLYHASPIAHIHKVTASVLLLIGDSDQRVAPTQGIGYYHALRALRTDSPDDIEMLIFPGEGHPLEGVEASKVVWLRTAKWFNREAV
ncbi:Alpha/Beta hydrolase protein [Lentinula detonsa]|uniref:acylaminoacyl-peptidase n=1 Tax=Lentinula detonsa TaxID=2804962 RepID=A0A9W8NXL6_9AGAR|nr:Alpha/Beta hydrolase protein [Lentinula detonsa]